MSTNVRFYLSYDFKITLKSHFCHKNVILSVQCCYVRHNVSHKSIIPLVVYQFYCMALYHSKTRRHVINYNIIRSLYQNICVLELDTLSSAKYWFNPGR